MVFVDAETDVGGGGGKEFGTARGDVRGVGVVLDSGDGRVQRVGGQVGAAVQEEDEAEGTGEDGGPGRGEK